MSGRGAGSGGLLLPAGTVLLVLVGRRENRFVHDLKCRAVFSQVFMYTHPNWPTPVNRLFVLGSRGPRGPLVLPGGAFCASVCWHSKITFVIKVARAVL